MLVDNRVRQNQLEEMPLLMLLMLLKHRAKLVAITLYILIYITFALSLMDCIQREIWTSESVTWIFD